MKSIEFELFFSYRKKSWYLDQVFLTTINFIRGGMLFPKS